MCPPPRRSDLKHCDLTVRGGCEECPFRNRRLAAGHMMVESTGNVRRLRSLLNKQMPVYETGTFFYRTRRRKGRNHDLAFRRSVQGAPGSDQGALDRSETAGVSAQPGALVRMRRRAAPRRHGGTLRRAAPHVLPRAPHGGPDLVARQRRHVLPVQPLHGALDALTVPTRLCGGQMARQLVRGEVPPYRTRPTHLLALGNGLRRRAQRGRTAVVRKIMRSSLGSARRFIKRAGTVAYFHGLQVAIFGASTYYQRSPLLAPRLALISGPTTSAQTTDAE